MGNSVHTEEIAIVSQHIILLTGVPLETDLLALQGQKANGKGDLLVSIRSSRHAASTLSLTQRHHAVWCHLHMHMQDLEARLHQRKARVANFRLRA